ncbi:putative VAMP-like protein-like [Dorcoceras hygrometricum]|uniref:Putative VAMP-like protein-like n=1 Tax=Dorcoceras hygrometricum TaxID=472368 RepID=A0A2Z7B966_9LAMI|nr:putative VAMP-like protein-like [Dorcoceras hygrometricum]
MMVLYPDVLHYACIAKGTTVLAEFNSKDEALGALAAKCLEKTPAFHSTFSHTVRSRTYAFLIDDPFIYFAIFDVKLENSEGFAFLKSVRGSFEDVFNRDSGKRRLEHLTSHCFQGEFNPVFHQLLGPALGTEMEGFGSPGWLTTNPNGMLWSGSRSIGRHNSDAAMRFKVIKQRWFGEFKEKGRINTEKRGEKRVCEENESPDLGAGREFSLVMHKNGVYSTELLGLHNHHKAKKVWTKQVWIVLSLDLIICTILFAVWLWVCSGFKCVDH